MTKAIRVVLMAVLTPLVLIPAYGRAQPRDEDPEASPAAVFHAQCALCHGEGGQSDTPAGRALEVTPLVNHAKLAAMTPEHIAAHIEADPKHRGVVTLRDADIARAAYFVKQLAHEQR